MRFGWFPSRQTDLPSSPFLIRGWECNTWSRSSGLLPLGALRKVCSWIQISRCHGPPRQCHYKAGRLFLQLVVPQCFQFPNSFNLLFHICFTELLLKAPWINMAVAFLRLRQWQRVLEAWLSAESRGFSLGKTIHLSWEDVEKNHRIMIFPNW